MNTVYDEMHKTVLRQFPVVRFVENIYCMTADSKLVVHLGLNFLVVAEVFIQRNYGELVNIHFNFVCYLKFMRMAQN